MSISPIASLSQAGVSIWLDDLSRRAIVSDDLAALIRDHQVVGVTTNPTIFAAAITDAASYQDQIASCAARGLDAAATIRELTTTDVADACDLFAEVFTQTDGRDGRVSIEVDPGLANDAAGTIQQARELWQTIDRPNAMIKIPATEAGIEAITAVIAEGISVNVTLVFDLAQYRRVLNAYQTGLEQARAAGRDLSAIRSVASIFISRVDTEVDRRLRAIGTPEALTLLHGAGIANAHLAHEIWAETRQTARSVFLRSQGANTQRLLWASTGTKDPALSPTAYVDALVTADTVNTMPRATLEAVITGGQFAEDRVVTEYLEANQLWNHLDGLGINYGEVMTQLASEGLAKFSDSWAELTRTVAAALTAAGTGSMSQEPA